MYVKSYSSFVEVWHEQEMRFGMLVYYSDIVFLHAMIWFLILYYPSLQIAKVIRHSYERRLIF